MRPLPEPAIVRQTVRVIEARLRENDLTIACQRKRCGQCGLMAPARLSRNYAEGLR
jgi:hypothetical protein